MEDLSKLKILIVDDNEINLMVMSDLLDTFNITKIKTLLSGAAAIEEIKSNANYDLILMDICMPKIDGCEATKQIRNMGYTGKIIALTAYDLSVDDPCYKEGKMNGIIMKPIDLKELESYLINQL